MNLQRNRAQTTRKIRQEIASN